MKRSVFSPWLWVILFVVSGVTGAEALALRCGTSIIAKGDHKEKVLDNCGEPTETVFLEERWKIKYESTYQSSVAHQERPYQWERMIREEWVYDKGSSRRVHRLLFENDIIVKISSGRQTW